jgi:hypothetical protein
MQSGKNTTKSQARRVVRQLITSGNGTYQIYKYGTVFEEATFISFPESDLVVERDTSITVFITLMMFRCRQATVRVTAPV